VAFDGRLALIALAGSLVVGIALGLPVVWLSLRNAAAPGLQAESRGATAGRAAQRLRHAFIVAQIALAFVLLAGAGLLGLSLQKVMTVSPGFRPGNVLSGQLVLPVRSYPDRQGQLLAVTERLTAEIGRQPGVQAVGFATNVPLSGISNKSAATAQGHRPQPGEAPHGFYSYSVGGDYFSALGLALREGRFLTAADSRRAERVCVIDEDFARRYWPRGGALGQRVFEGAVEGSSADAYTVVGVVGPVKQAGLAEDEAQGAIYYPFGHRMDHSIYLVVRASLPLESLAPALRKAVRRIDPELPINDLRTMEARLVARRSPVLLAVLFAAIAMLLTAVGTYGVLSYAVTQRRREIGLRMALGARPEQVRGQYLALALRLLAAGMALGILGAWLTGRAMQAVLFQVPPLQVATLAGAAALLGAVSLAACLLPSRRAARVSPMVVLSEE
jgi:predicted permease